jgi:hypothetical protein
MSNEGNPSPSTGADRFSEETQKVMAARRELPAPAAAMTAIVPGGLYGTDGANLYLIDTATGAASLIGAHGPVAPVAVDVVYTATDPSGRTLTMDVQRVKGRAK